MKFHEYPVPYIGEVDLKVQDINRSIEFYQTIIGFKVLEKTDNKAVLTADGKTPLLLIEQPKNVTPLNPRTTGLYHFALLLPTRHDLAKALIHLVRSNYPLQGASDHYVSEAIYLADPDGNGIEIYADRPDSTWEWKNGEVNMATVALNAPDLAAEDDRTPWTGLPAGTVMGHIHIQVSDIKQSEEFYTKGLGLDVVCEYGQHALFVSYGGYHHHIGLNTWNSLGGAAPEETSVGLKQYHLVLPSEEERNKIVQQLRDMKATVSDVNGEFVTSDPSGNQIKLVVGQ